MTLSDLISIFLSLFTFLVSGLSTVADFFTSNLLGQIIIGMAIFSIVAKIVGSYIDKIK